MIARKEAPPERPANDRCIPGAERALVNFDRSVLSGYPGSIIGIDDEFKIFYLNQAWDEFAEENGGGIAIRNSWGLGADYLSALPSPVRSFYEQLLLSAKAGSSDQRPIQHEYECSSPVIFRKFQMNVYGLLDCSGVLIVNSLVVERPHLAEENDPDAPLTFSKYVDDLGIVKQCCHCRRIARPAESGGWDWIPEWVERPPDNTSHSLCEVCFQSYYTDL